MIIITLKEYPKINERVHIETLPNGLTIYVIPKQGFHKTFAIYAAKYGGSSRRFKHLNEWTDTPKGVAHFLEHLMFNTTEGNALTKLTTNGASANAYTSDDTTAYYFETIDMFYENLEILLNFVSVPYFTEEDIKSEHGIIEQEILMYEDDPEYSLYYGLMKSLFMHNSFRDPVAGTIESISKITADTLHSCHSVFYHPSNMVLCVAGDVDPEKIAQTAEKILPKTHGEVPKLHNEEPENLKPERHTVSKSMDISLPIFASGAKSLPPSQGSNKLHLELLNSLAMNLLAGHSSPLYFKLYDKGLVNTDFSATFDFSPSAAYSVFSGESRDPQSVVDEIKKEIVKLTNDGPDPSFFSRIKKAAQGSYTRSLNSFESICGSFIDGHFHNYDPLTALDILMAIKLEDITKFYGDNLNIDNMATSIVKPNSHKRR